MSVAGWWGVTKVAARRRNGTCSIQGCWVWRLPATFARAACKAFGRLKQLEGGVDVMSRGLGA